MNFILNENINYRFIDIADHTQKFIQLFCTYRKFGFKRILIDYLYEYGIPTI